MKKRLLRGLALGVAAVMALSPVAEASQAMGEEIHSVTVSLAQGVEMTGQAMWSATYSDLRSEHFMTYIPAEGIRPVVAYGSKITSRETLGQMAQALEAQGKRVLGGVNGDYYVLSSGAPLGMLISEGRLLSTPQYTESWGLGFLEDGTAMIGQPQISVMATFGGQTLSVSGGINKIRAAQGGYYLLTEEFGDTTKNTEAGVDVILRPLEENLGQTVEVDVVVGRTGEESSETEDATSAEGTHGADLATESGELGKEDVLPDVAEGPERVVATLTRSRQLHIGSRVSCEVVSVLHSEAGTAIPEGCYVMTINAQGDAWLVEQLTALAEGDRVEIDIVGKDPRWTEVVTALGGMYKLVSDGAVEEGLDNAQAPRSAVGVRADGSAVFYTVDGRQSGYSVGADLTQVARRLIELGCVEAVCMDGGGSTTFGATLPDEESMTLINRPSDGKQRANSNALFLVSEKEPSETLDRFYVDPPGSLLLGGASVQLKATAVDTEDFPMPWSGRLKWSVLDGGGSVTKDGYYTSQAESGTAEVGVSSAEAEGSAKITVIRTPDAFWVKQETTGTEVTELVLEPNQTLELTAESVYRNLKLVSQDENYVWTLDPVVGKVDDTGKLTAASASASGYPTVSAGDKSVAIPVTVSGHILPLEDFESGVDALAGGEGSLVEWEKELEKVRFGRSSAKITYDAASGAADVAVSLPVDSGERYLTLWVQGDGSTNILMASVMNERGENRDVILTALDFSGWRRVTAALPAGTVGISGLRVLFGGEKPEGTIWLDQLTTANELVIDAAAPVIRMEVTQGELRATVVDVIDQKLNGKNLSVQLDGEEIDFTWEAEKALITATLPAEDGLMHRVTVNACDASGNLAREGASFFFGESPEEPFEDMEGHWAQSFTDYLYQRGITNGVATETGAAFYPEKEINRGEFALMVARWQGLDLEAYADVELPYADLEEIPEWMLPALRAMYAEGVMKGSLEGGKIYANALKGVSRAEAMTILGRIQDKGYPLPELEFEDADQVAAWALDFVKSLVGQGVVGGYDNKINPNAPVKRGEVAKMLVSLT